MIITGSARCVLNFVNSIQTVPTINPVATLIDTSTLVGLRTKYSQNYEVSVKILIESLEATSNISSIQKAKLPLIAPEDTPQERQKKMQDFQSRFPKIGLQILLDNGDGAGWIPHATVSLQNQGGEYYEDYLSPQLSSKEYLPLGASTKIGIKSVDLGNGLIRGSDYILVDCTYSIELIFRQPQLIEPGKDGIYFTSVLIPAGGSVVLTPNTCKLGYALSISTSSDCKVRYYQTLSDLTADTSRIEAATGFIQGLCFEMSLGTGIDSFGNQNTILSAGFRPNTVIGNRDTPRSSTAYLLLSNPRTSDTTISLVFRYSVIQ